MVRTPALPAVTRELVERLPLPAALAAFDGPQSMVLVNDPFVRTFGYALDDIPTMGDWAARVFPDEAYRRDTVAAWDAAVARARAGTGQVEAMEFRVTCRDGTTRDVVFGAALAGELLLLTCVDVTQRRLERTAYELTASIPVGTYIIAHGSDGMPRFTFVSDRWLQMLDLRREDVLADASLAFRAVHPDEHDAFVRLSDAAMALGQTFVWEGRIVVRNETRWVSIESRPRRPPGGCLIWEGVMIDVTRRREAEAALAAAREQERMREHAQRRDLEAKLRTSLIAAATAHEINQPLARILLETQLAIERLRDAPPGGSHLEDYLEGMLAESRHVVDMLGRMKSLLRNVQSDHGPVELAAAVASAVLFSRPLLDEHGVSLQETGLDRDVRIHGDGVQLQTAIINLIRNAVEAIDATAPRRRMISIELTADDDRAGIVVGDTGPGMPPEQITAAPFATSKPDGSGLGLYLVRTCMENHGGTVAIGRAPLGGAEVRLTLPRTRDGATH